MWKKHKFEWNFKRCEYFGGPARTQATECILGKGGSPRYPRLRGQRRRAKDDAKKAETGDRTPDLPLTKRLLYQLSYLGINNGKLSRTDILQKTKKFCTSIFSGAAKRPSQKALFFHFPQCLRAERRLNAPLQLVRARVLGHFA